MDTYHAIMTRRTIRLFDQRPVHCALLERILNAGRLAPSAANRQVLEFIDVLEPGNCKKLFDQLAWAAYVQPNRNPPPDKRPTAYVIVLIHDKEINTINASDAAAAMENMILAAWNEGVGSCWIGSVKREKVKEIFQIPETYCIFGVLALGFPAEQPSVEVLKDKVEYWLDEKNQLHVPKRRLGDIVHHEVFRKS